MGSNGAEVCSNCRREIPCSEQACIFEGKIVCAACDKKLRKPLTNVTRLSRSAVKNLEQVQPHVAVSNVQKIKVEYKGVGGWLLVLCLILTVISPVGNVILLFLKSIQAHSLLQQFPNLRTILISESFLTVGLTVFSVYAGIGLWMVRPYAVKIAKSYFIVLFVSQLLFYAFIAKVMLVAAGVPAGGAVKVEFISPSYKLGLYASCWIWFSYLSKSKRVKATYV